MQLVEYKKNLNSLIDQGELGLPSNVSPDAFRNAAIVAYTDNPQIAKCAPASVFKSIRKIAAMGLVPDNIEAALVPFGNQCQAMPMIAGLRKLARNSAEVASLWDDVVYENETILLG